MDLDEGFLVQANAKNLREANIGWFDYFSCFFRPHTIMGFVSSMQQWMMKLEEWIHLWLANNMCYMFFSFSNFSHIIWQATLSRRVPNIELFTQLFYLLPLDMVIWCKVSLGIIYNFFPKFPFIVKISYWKIKWITLLSIPMMCLLLRVHYFWHESLVLYML